MEEIQIIKQILASDIINWLLAFIGGGIVYNIVDNMQTKIERHSVIKDIEKSINELFAHKIAKSNKGSRDNDIEDVNIRTIFHDNSPWEIYDKEKTEVTIKNSQRYVLVRDDQKYKEYISTQALHESLILFRRIEKLFKDSILKPIDLADMWREILPFGSSKRLEFYKAYFSEYDIQSIVFVLFNTVLACHRYKINNAIEYFKKYYNDNDEIHNHFYKNNRYRIHEKIKLRYFKHIIKG